MSDLERSLRDLAGPATPLDIGAVDRRATRIRRRRQGAVGGVAASLVIVAMVLVASAWNRGDEQSVVVAPPETTEASETTEPAPSDEPEPEVSCPASELAPTYLPWAGELPDPAEPDRLDPTDAGPRALFLDDLAGALDGELDFFATMAVAISTRPSLDDVLGELDRSAFSMGEIRGSDAYLVWVGDPGVGGVYIAWDEDDGSPCSAYRVDFPSTGPIADHLGVVGIHAGDAAAIEEELVHVVESLRQRGDAGSHREADVLCPPPELHPSSVPWDHEGGPIEPVDQLDGGGTMRVVYRRPRRVRAGLQPGHTHDACSGRRVGPKHWASPGPSATRSRLRWRPSWCASSRRSSAAEMWSVVAGLRRREGL